jgi:hypothetical protein
MPDKHPILANSSTKVNAIGQVNGIRGQGQAKEDDNHPDERYGSEHLSPPGEKKPVLVIGLVGPIRRQCRRSRLVNRRLWTDNSGWCLDTGSEA